MEWISVKDRLPNEQVDGKWVLWLCDEFGSKNELTYHDKCYVGKIMEGCTHWMPLPEPPKK